MMGSELVSGSSLVLVEKKGNLAAMVPILCMIKRDRHGGIAGYGPPAEEGGRTGEIGASPCSAGALEQNAGRLSVSRAAYSIRLWQAAAAERVPARNERPPPGFIVQIPLHGLAQARG